MPKSRRNIGFGLAGECSVRSSETFESYSNRVSVTRRDLILERFGESRANPVSSLAAQGLAAQLFVRRQHRQDEFDVAAQQQSVDERVGLAEFRRRLGMPRPAPLILRVMNSLS